MDCPYTHAMSTPLAIMYGPSPSSTTLSRRVCDYVSAKHRTAECMNPANLWWNRSLPSNQSGLMNVLHIVGPPAAMALERLWPPMAYNTRLASRMHKRGYIHLVVGVDTWSWFAVNLIILKYSAVASTLLVSAAPDNSCAIHSPTHCRLESFSAMESQHALHHASFFSGEGTTYMPNTAIC